MPMRRILPFALLLAALAAFSISTALAQAGDRLRVAPGTVAVRENPSNGSPKVMSLKPGQRVRIDYEADGWVAVFPPEQKNRAESAALGYVRLSDLRLAGPLDLKRDPNGAPVKDEAKASEKNRDADKKKSDKGKTAAERRKEAKAAAERERKEAAKEAKAAKNVKEGKALKVAGGKGALARDEMPTTPQQKATVRTASVVVEKPVDPEQRAAVKAALAEAKAEAKGEARQDKPKPAPAPKEEDFGVIRMPDRPLAVRAARTKDSEFKKLLQPGQKVRTDFHSDGFFAVFAPEERVRDIKRAWGYGRDKYLFTEKELAQRGFYSPPGQPKPESKPEIKPESKPETKPESKPEAKPEAKPEPKAEARPAAPAAPVEPKKPAPQPEHRNATAPAAPAAATVPVPPAAQPVAQAAPQAPERKPAPVQAEPAPATADEVLGYSLLERREDPLRPLAPVQLRVRLETAHAPSQETLRRVVREIWKGERRKADEVVMEVYLLGMDSTSLAYAVARFGPDGKIRELYWRESLAPRKR